MVERTASPRSAQAAERAHRRGRMAHPGVSLPTEAFAEHVVACATRRLARRGEAPTDAALAAEIEASDAGDLYLAAAGTAGVPGAWERIEGLHAPGLVGLGRSRGVGGAEVEQQVLELWSNLAVAASGPRHAPPLSQYDGSGRLFAWLATCFLRRLAARGRGARAARPLPDGAPAPATGLGEDPASALERRETEAALESAVRRAVDELTLQERAALVLAHRDGWSGREVARLLGVGEPRASRLKTRATEKVREALLPALRARGLRGAGGSWDALREAVSAALSSVAIPAAPARPSGEDPSVRRPHDG